MRRHGMQEEILLSLALVMVMATGLLAAFLLKAHSNQIHGLHDLIGRAIMAEVYSPTFQTDPAARGARWWQVDAEGRARAVRGASGALEDAGLELAREARSRRRALVQGGASWEPIFFAVPQRSGGGVAVARLDPALSSTAMAALLAADAVVFTVLGAYLIRRRVVLPLRRLAGATRSIARGALRTRASVEGVDETAELAVAFNDMTEALEQRTSALEEAVTDLRSTNETLEQARAGLDRAERLAAVGRLAAGVAHEVGNPLAALLAFLDLAGREEGLTDQGRSHLARASGQGERVRVILRQLLDFSRPPRTAKGRVDVHAVAEQTIALVAAQQRYSGIEIQLDAPSTPPAALADEGVLGQILLNLVLNAADAVLEAGGSFVRVRIATEAPLPASPAADSVVCEVSDDGSGVPEADRESIFDPFFTTKAPGDGTGLGLATALRQAVEMDGELRQDRSAELGGAAFTLRLPGASRSGALSP